MKQFKKVIFLAVLLSFGGQVICSEANNIKGNRDLKAAMTALNQHRNQRRAFSVSSDRYRHIGNFCLSPEHGVGMKERSSESGLSLSDADFESGRFSYATIRDSSLPKAVFRNAYLEKSDLLNSKLPGATFAGAIIADCRFENSDLSHSNWAGVKLSGWQSSFKGTDLTGMTGLEDPKTKIDSKVSFQGAKNMPFGQRFAAKRKGASVDMTRAEKFKYNVLTSPDMDQGSY